MRYTRDVNQLTHPIFAGHKVLVANRGEIALRVIRTCKALGLKTVALYSEPDIQSLHVRHADEAYCVGPAQSSLSYLNIEKVLEIAKQSHSTLIHPGYGFLSENPDFVDACVAQRLIFIGPSAECMRMMGDKIQARIQAKKSGLPLIEGSADLKDVQQGKEIAQQVGFPILLKAKAGGGGKGMRLVESLQDLESAFNMAQSEANNAFGNDTLYIEKYLKTPRHIEVQVFGKSNKETLILGLRDCSIQRRHQKIIEEAGFLGLSQKAQDQLHSYAHKLCQSLNYQGAGTLEFLVDAQEHIFFLEMNTRLQVEHPVTEWIFGIDLVHMQVLNALQADQDFIQPPQRGHALEVRIYAENPAQNFMPSPGTLNYVQWPQGPDIRVDTAIENKHEISSYYDPMIAKVSCYAQSRALCVGKMLNALQELKISGIHSNVEFLKHILRDADFLNGAVHTQFIDAQRVKNIGKAEPKPLDLALCAAFDYVNSQTPAHQTEAHTALNPSPSKWWESGLN